MGKNVELFQGVEDWFDRINDFGAQNGVQVEHYVISSGMKEIIEGTSISGSFKSIFACEFFYDENGGAVWPKTDVNYTNKTQFVYRINKGVLDVANDLDLNRSMPEDSKRVPFTNMIYIGDGLSRRAVHEDDEGVRRLFDRRLPEPRQQGRGPAPKGQGGFYLSCRLQRGNGA